MAQDFSHCKMEYQRDEQGKEVLLKDGKFQVMMEWEKPYMHACIDALKPFGDVLEIGFGLGYSAERIQTYHPKSHTIIEYPSRGRSAGKGVGKAIPTCHHCRRHLAKGICRIWAYSIAFSLTITLCKVKRDAKNAGGERPVHFLLQKGQAAFQGSGKSHPFLIGDQIFR